MHDVDNKRRRTVDSIVLFKQLDDKTVIHGYLGNSNPYFLGRGEDLGNCCPRLSQNFFTHSGQYFDFSPQRHCEITVYYQRIVDQSDFTCYSIKVLKKDADAVAIPSNIILFEKRYSAVLKLDKDDLHN